MMPAGLASVPPLRSALSAASASSRGSATAISSVLSARGERFSRRYFVQQSVLLFHSSPSFRLCRPQFSIGLGLGGSATLYIPLLMGIYIPEKDTAIVGVFDVAVSIATLAMPPLGTASVAYIGSFTIAISTLATASTAIRLSRACGGSSRRRKRSNAHG